MAENNFGSIWFFDLFGNPKWYFDVGTNSILDQNRVVQPFCNLHAVIQTADGNFVAAGVISGKHNAPYNQTSTSITNYVPLNDDVYRGYVVKIDKQTHSVLWEKIYDLGPVPNSATNGKVTWFYDLIEDETTKNLIIAGRGMDMQSYTFQNANTTYTTQDACVFELNPDGILIDRKTLKHNNMLTSNTEGIATSTVQVSPDNYVIAGRNSIPVTNGNFPNVNLGFVCKFSSNHQVGGLSFAQSLTLGNNSGSNLTWDIGQLNNATKDLILPLFESNGSIFNVSNFYKIDPNNLNNNSKLIDPITNTPYDLGTMNAYDLQNDVLPTKDGGFLFVSSKNSIPTNSTTITFDDNMVKTFGVGTGDCESNTWHSDAYAAKFNVNLVKEWEERYPFDDYDNSITNKGEVKRAECLYAAIEHPDGGYVIAGNNSANLDDHILLKLNSACSQNIGMADYAPPFTSTGNPNIYINTNYNLVGKNINVNSLITINSGASLTLDNCILKFGDAKENTYANPGIVIYPGGKLIIKNNSVLTSFCPNTMWNGICVLGQANQLQNISDQGYLEVTNSTIENARIAIAGGLFEGIKENGRYKYKFNETELGGGIIVAAKSNFINNARDIDIRNYISQNLSTNKSIFFKNRFVFNDGKPFDESFYKTESDDEHFPFKYRGKDVFIYLQTVEGVNFISNNIDNNSNDPLNDKGTGILANNATFNVKQKQTSASALLGLVPEGELNNCEKSNFSNLYIGIEANACNPLKGTLIVDNTNITNVRKGINLSGHLLPFPTITRNDIKVNVALESEEMATQTWGINSIANLNYDIAENTIAALSSDAIAQRSQTAIAVNNKHEFDTKIYKNNISSFKNGVHAFGQNRNLLPGKENDGLFIDCNNIALSEKNGILVSEDQSGTTTVAGSIRLQQGDCINLNLTPTPVSNSFNVNNNDIGTLGSTMLFNYEHPNILAMIPNSIGNFNVINCAIFGNPTNIPQCKSYLKSCNDEIGIYDLGEELAGIKTQITALNQNPGSIETSIQLLKLEKYLEDLSLTNGLSSNQYLDAQSYYKNKGELNDYQNILLYCLASIFNNKTDALGFLEDVDDMSVVKIDRLNRLSNNNYTTQILSTDELNYSKQINMNVLSLASGNNRTYYVPESVEASSKANKEYVKLIDNNNSIAIYPNPSSSNFSIEFNNNQKGMEYVVQIFDVCGKLVFSNSYKFYNVQSIKPDLPSGMYFVKIANQMFKVLKND